MKEHPNIHPVYFNQFPTSYINSAQAWGNFTREKLQENRGRMLTMDIDYPCDSCSLNCAECFRKGGVIESSGHKRASFDQTIEIIHQAKNLGLLEVKILGDLEPFESYSFLDFLMEVTGLGIKVGIFSNLVAFGNDQVACKYHGRHGIKSGHALAKRMFDLGIAIYGKCNSFDSAIQDRMVQTPGYSMSRNRGFEVLVEARFNAGQPTRLAGIIAPLTKLNYPDAFETYVWLRRRNIYPVITVSMVSGRGRNLWQKVTPPAEQIIDLYSRINIWNIESGIGTLDELTSNMPSAYAGCHQCHQCIGCYVTSTGIVLRCPGDDVTTFGDVREKSLEHIWKASENYERSLNASYNCHCPPKDGLSLPSNLYEEVTKRVVAHFS